MKNTQYRIADYRESSQYVIEARNAEIDWLPFARAFSHKDASRVVACLNAMEGIEDPAAARVILDEPQTQYAADLLAELKEAVKVLEASPVTLKGCSSYISAFKTVIAKASGK